MKQMQEDARQTSRWFREALGVVVVLGSVLTLYAGALRGFFVQDDYSWILYSRFTSLGDYLSCFVRFNAFGGYRPLSQETFFWLGQKLFDLQPFGYHAISLAAHMTATFLVYLLLRRFLSLVPSLAGALIFGVHGAHLRSVYWISALPEPLALVFFLAALLAFLRFDRENDRRFYVLSIAFMILGLGSKESILSLPLVIGFYCLLMSPQRLIGTIPFFAISGLYALSRAMSSWVGAGPYALSFGRETWRNLSAYFAWGAGFSDSLVQTGLRRNPEETHTAIAVGFVLVIIFLVFLSKTRRVALFSVLWFLSALQPVLYFSRHNYAYYLAPALPGLSFLLASSLPDPERLRTWLRGTHVAVMMLFLLFSSVLTVRLEGSWWIERTLARRDFLAEMEKVDRQVPAGGTAYIFGLSPDQFDVFENGAAFKVFGIPQEKFSFVIPLPDFDRELILKRLEETGGPSSSYCFVLVSNRLVDRTLEFRENPEPFFDLDPVQYEHNPGVAFEVHPVDVTRGRDTLVIRARNLEAPAIDVLYSIDGRLMPAVTQWLLDEKQSTTVFVDRTTPAGLYHFRAIRDSRKPHNWIKVDARVLVR